MKKWQIAILLFIITIFLVASLVFIFDNKTSYMVQMSSSCNYEDIISTEVLLEIQNEDFTLIATELTEEQYNELKDNSCIQRITEIKDLDKVLDDVQSDLDQARDDKFRDIRLNRTLENEDVIDRDDLQSELEKLHPNETWPGGVIAPYQLYVTPDADAVQDLADQLDGIEEIYSESLSWVWISEELLNGVPELWLLPEEFLTNTPTYPTNPTNRIASDCEDQANALVSVLIADGYDPENVRVVLGLVNMDGQVGGHAWVEVYENGWFAVDATMGDYYDETTNQLVETGEVPYKYFKFHTYPVIDVWFYYNNEYFLDVTTNRGNAPPSWRQSARTWLQQEFQNFQGQQPKN